MDNVDGLAVKSYRGASISEMEGFIKNDNLHLDTFDYIILHVGTNDVNYLPIKKIMQAYKFLFRACAEVSGQVPIAVSAILPRPIDYDTTREICKNINLHLEEFCKNHDLKFVRSYKRFLFAGRPITKFYATRDGGLHLSYEGTRQLRQCFIHTICHL